MIKTSAAVVGDRVAVDGAAEELDDGGEGNEIEDDVVDCVGQPGERVHDPGEQEHGCENDHSWPPREHAHRAERRSGHEAYEGFLPDGRIGRVVDGCGGDQRHDAGERASGRCARQPACGHRQRSPCPARAQYQSHEMGEARLIRW